MSALCHDSFVEWPVWSEFYEIDELREIESWGRSRQQFLADIERLNLGNEHAAYPVLKLDPIPDRMRVYIKARFKCVNGRTLDGYVVNPDAYAFCLFVDREEFIFNVNLKRECDSELVSLAERLRSAIDLVKPVSFDTEFRDSEGERIAGKLLLP